MYIYIYSLPSHSSHSPLTPLSLRSPDYAPPQSSFRLGGGRRGPGRGSFGWLAGNLDGASASSCSVRSAAAVRMMPKMLMEISRSLRLILRPDRVVTEPEYAAYEEAVWKYLQQTVTSTQGQNAYIASVESNPLYVSNCEYVTVTYVGDNSLQVCHLKEGSGMLQTIQKSNMGRSVVLFPVEKRIKRFCFTILSQSWLFGQLE